VRAVPDAILVGQDVGVLRENLSHERRKCNLIANSRRRSVLTRASDTLVGLKFS